jgi:hypothetical protein
MPDDQLFEMRKKFGTPRRLGVTSGESGRLGR